MEYKDRKALAGEKVVQIESMKQKLDQNKEKLKEVESLLASANQHLPGLEKEISKLEGERTKILKEICTKERDAQMVVDSIDLAISKINDMKNLNERDRDSTDSTDDFREKVFFILLNIYFLI